jgi:hypothetical protein
VSVKQLVLAPRGGGAALLEVREVEVEVRLLPLLVRRIEVARAVVFGPEVRATIAADGRNDFLELFQGPPGEPGTAAGRGEKVRERQRFVAALDELRVVDGAASVALAKSNLRLELVAFSGQMDAIEVDPDNLAATNRAALEIAGVVRVFELERPAELGLVELRGPASVRLFDPVSGELSPDADGHLAIGAGSYLGTRLPLFAKSWGKLDAIRNLGVGVPLVPERLELTEGAVALRYRNGAWELFEPLRGSLDGWELLLDKGFTIDPSADRQAGALWVYPTDEWAQAFLASVGGLLGKVSESLGTGTEAELRDTWYQDGRMVIILDVEGSLSSPEVDLRNPLPDGKKMLENAGKGLLDRLLGD